MGDKRISSLHTLSDKSVKSLNLIGDSPLELVSLSEKKKKNQLKNQKWRGRFFSFLVY